MDNVVAINTEFIKLQQFLKLCGAVETGGIAKLVIEDEHVKVNGETCAQRGKKLYPGDTVEFDSVVYKVEALG